MQVTWCIKLIYKPTKTASRSVG